MQILWSTNITLCFFALTSVVLSRSLFNFIAEQEETATKLENRQISGVISTSQFLRRAYQASTIVDNYIYIDGGEFSFINNGTMNFNYSNTILSIDLSQNWTNSTVKITSTAKPAGCASLNSPSLWYNALKGVLYSGFAGWKSLFNNEDIDLNKISIWTFTPDGTGSGAWKDVIPSGSTALSSMNRPERSFQAFGNDSAWVLGGFDEYDPNNLPSMVHFNMSSRTFVNVSSPATLANSGAVDNGAMHYVPSFGPQGFFVAMGGDTVLTVPGLVSFDTVAVFDPAKQEWFNQSTTGSPPTSRLEFCTAGIESTNGTYEIFVYAGWGGTLGTASVQYDTINILTLPAFHWISVPNDPKNSRIGLSCNAVGGSQILTIGGRDGNPPEQIFGLNLWTSTYNSSDPNAQGLAIFDLKSLTWLDQYTAGAPPYEHSDPVKEFYSNGQQKYSPNITAGVAALLQVTHFTNTTNSSSTGPATQSSTSTSSSNPSHNATGSIIGCVVGGIFALAFAAGCMLFFLKRRSKRKRQGVGSAGQIPGVYSRQEREEKTPLQEMDQDTARKAELGGGGRFEMDQDTARRAELGGGRRFGMESRQVSVSELGHGRRE